MVRWPVRGWWWGLVLVTAAGPLAAEPPLTRAAGVVAHPEVDAVFARFAAAYDLLDPAAIAALYTEDALYLVPGAEPVRGRPAVEASFRRAFEAVRREGGRLGIRFEILERVVAGATVSDVGIYHLARGGPDGESTVRGKFVTIARRGDDGAWRLHVDGYSGIDEPQDTAPAPPAAARDALLAAERAFAAAFARRDRDAFFAAVAPDAVFLAPDRALHGKAAVEEAWGRLLAAPEAPFSWAPARGEVNAAGTLGLTTGPVYAGESWVGSFLSIWRREPDGTWRVIFDGSPSCEAPAAPAPGG
jgi:uncharacterized protein (TIGR02246 family)